MTRTGRTHNPGFQPVPRVTNTTCATGSKTTARANVDYTDPQTGAFVRSYCKCQANAKAITITPATMR
jgi:hypothetical protein